MQNLRDSRTQTPVMNLKKLRGLSFYQLVRAHPPNHSQPQPKTPKDNPTPLTPRPGGNPSTPKFFKKKKFLK
jgi:hypothetical protein